MMVPYIDMHCDTVSEIWYSRLRKDPISLAKNDLMIDLDKLTRGGCLCQRQHPSKAAPRHEREELAGGCVDPRAGVRSRGCRQRVNHPVGKGDLRGKRVLLALPHPCELRTRDRGDVVREHARRLRDVNLSRGGLERDGGLLDPPSQPLAHGLLVQPGPQHARPPRSFGLPPSPGRTRAGSEGRPVASHPNQDLSAGREAQRAIRVQEGFAGLGRRWPGGGWCELGPGAAAGTRGMLKPDAGEWPAEHCRAGPRQNSRCRNAAS